MARRKQQSTSRPNKTGSTESPNASSPRVQSWRSGKRASGVRKETLRVAYEEIKFLREDLPREGESMDKNKCHFMTPENTEEIRILEQQELALWRGSASKRQAGWTRDGSVEETPAGCWKLRDSTEKWIQRRENSKSRSRKNPGKMPEWETTPWMVWMVLCRREGANTDIASNIRVETACGRERIRVCRVL